MLKKLSWQEILQSFSGKERHFMEDVPVFVEARPYEIGHVSDVPLEKWRANVSASEVYSILTKDGAEVYWSCQEIEIRSKEGRHLPSLKNRTEIVILQIKDSLIFATWGTFKDLIGEFPGLFKSRLQQSIRILSGLGLSSCQMMVHKEQQLKKKILFFCEFKSPRLEDVVCYHGKEEEGLIDLLYDDVTYSFCKKKGSDCLVSVPSPIIFLSFQRFCVPKGGADFLSEEYYQRDMQYYSSWSYPLHHRQVTELFSNFPSGWTVVCPGDGMGVCYDAWKGKKICGDLCGNGPIVKETFAETMMRGMKHDGLKVLVLSYVLSLFSSKDLELMEKWQGPIVIIDIKMSSPVSNFVCLAPGIFGRDLNLQLTVIPSSVERNPAWQKVQFSENLLRLEKINYDVESPSVQYWKRMRPFGKVEEGGTLVVHNLEELSGKCVLKNNDISISSLYLSSIGKVIDKLRKVPSDGKYFGREVYFCPKTVYKEIKQSSFYPCGRFVLFFFLENQEVKSETSFSDYAREGDLFRVRIFSTDFYWDLSNPLVCLLAFDFLSFYGRPGWKYRAFGSVSYERPWNNNGPLSLFIPYYNKLEKEGFVTDPYTSPFAWKSEKSLSCKDYFQNKADQQLLEVLSDYTQYMCKKTNERVEYHHPKSKKKK